MTGVLLVRAAQMYGGSRQLGVEFQAPPPLKRFFALEQRLGETCGATVDLLPVDSLSLARRAQGLRLALR